jgi:hypothetical protein
MQGDVKDAYAPHRVRAHSADLPQGPRLFAVVHQPFRIDHVLEESVERLELGSMTRLFAAKGFYQTAKSW